MSCKDTCELQGGWWNNNGVQPAVCLTGDRTQILPISCNPCLTWDCKDSNGGVPKMILPGMTAPKTILPGMTAPKAILPGVSRLTEELADPEPVPTQWWWWGAGAVAAYLILRQR